MSQITNEPDVLPFRNINKRQTGNETEAKALATIQPDKVEQTSLREHNNNGGSTVSNKRKLSTLNLLEEFTEYLPSCSDINDVPFSKFKVSTAKHFIKTSGRPCTTKCRRISPEKMKALDEYLEDMLRIEVIRKSSSPWLPPIQMVRKKYASWRIYGDYRTLN